MPKRCGLVILALVLLVPSGAAAQLITDGASLKKRCDTVQILMPSSGVGCRGYIGAVIDVLADGNVLYEYRACPPLNEKREKLILAVRSWMDRHPESLDQSAAAAEGS